MRLQPNPIITLEYTSVVPTMQMHLSRPAPFGFVAVLPSAAQLRVRICTRQTAGIIRYALQQKRAVTSPAPTSLLAPQLCSARTATDSDQPL